MDIILNNQDLVKQFMVGVNHLNNIPIDSSSISNKDLKNIKLRLTLTLEKTQELFESFISLDKTSYNFDPLFNILKSKLQNIDIDSLDIDLEKVATTLADLQYISYGTAICLNIPLQECFQEVHKSNMTKLINFTGKPIYRDDGKILYDSSYTPPNIKSILDSRTSD